MKNLALITFTIYLFSIMPASGQKPRHYYKAGEEFMETGRVQDAIDQFTKAIELDPNYVDAYVERALAHEESNDLEKAKEDLERALVFDNEEEEIHYLAARVAYKMKNYDASGQHLDKALKTDPKLLEALQLQSKVLLKLNNPDNALIAAKKSVIVKNNAESNYCLGMVNEALKNYKEAGRNYEKAISKDKEYLPACLALASLHLKLGKTEDALDQCNKVITLKPKNTEARLIRSRIYAKQLEYPKAIDDISKNILVDADNPAWYLARGSYYQEFTQHMSAVNDFTKVILLDESNAEAYYKRAHSYEQTGNFEAAIKDYKKINELSEYDPLAKKMQDKAEERLFRLNKERNEPEVVFIDPVIKNPGIIEFPKGKEFIQINGVIQDESAVKRLQINNKDIPFIRSGNNYKFTANIEPGSSKVITVTAVDVYDNLYNASYSIKRTEIDPPAITLLAPYASDNNEIYLDNPGQSIFIEGKINDDSRIKSILIDGVAASYAINENNPGFTANVNIANKNAITVKVVDEYGNETVLEYTINRDGVSLAENNPMGKTWIVFVENSNYRSFASLEGPQKDVTLMRSALARYKINKVIHKKDLTKQEMEKFFAIDLRNLVKSNNVNTLLVWYAGHGKFINETGYWIPIDAKRDDEFTYFNINSLRASLQSYVNLTHTLVVTDACESGPTFYQAMRGKPTIMSCDDWKATKFKSSQVFSSAGYELAVDNSQFTRTFANTLVNNPNSCIPIEAIVEKVSLAVQRNNQQKPVFGKITGLEDENGTFFFVAKE